MREVSINVPFYNRLDTLSRCIQSIEAYTPRDLYELVLINDGSTDEKAVEYAKNHADIFVDHTENLGASQSLHDGILNSTCKYIGICDSDTIVPPRWLETLLRTFNLDHLHPDLSKIPNDPRFVRVGVDVKILSALLYGRVSQCIFGNQLRTANWILLAKEVGCYCMLFEKSLIDLIGNFDPLLFNVWTDLDFTRRISHNVFNLPNNPIVALDTRVVAYHHGWVDPSTGIFYGEPRNPKDCPSDEPLEKTIKIAKGLKLLFDRWGAIWEHPKNDFYMKLLVENGIEAPLCESLAHFPLYDLKPLE